MHSPSRLPLGLLLAACLTAGPGCTNEQLRLDAETQEALKTSFERVSEHYKSNAALLARWAQATKLYEAEFLADHPDDALPPWDAVDDMRPIEFMSFVERLTTNDANLLPSPNNTPIFPSPAYASRLYGQLELERVMLEEARNRIQDEGFNTINQYPILDVAFLPPREDVPVEFDEAKFLVTLRNASSFDAYRPVFEIRIFLPEDDVPVLERDFGFEKHLEPIAPGETRIFEMRCCSLASDPYHNARLKALTPDAKIEVNLKKVMNHGTQELLKTEGFAMTDYLRLGVVTQCLAEMKDSLAAWTPGVGAGSSECAGGNPDPDLGQAMVP